MGQNPSARCQEQSHPTAAHFRRGWRDRGTFAMRCPAQPCFHLHRARRSRVATRRPSACSRNTRPQNAWMVPMNIRSRFRSANCKCACCSSVRSEFRASASSRFLKALAQFVRCLSREGNRCDLINRGAAQDIRNESVDHPCRLARTGTSLHQHTRVEIRREEPRALRHHSAEPSLLHSFCITFPHAAEVYLLELRVGAGMFFRPISTRTFKIEARNFHPTDRRIIAVATIVLAHGW